MAEERQEVAVTASPMGAEAEQLYKQFGQKYSELQRKAEGIPLIILVWGPGIKGAALYTKRWDILNSLRPTHAALFSEHVDETYPAPQLSTRQREFLQAQLADFIVVLQCSQGSTAEVHDFSRYPELASKMLIFFDNQYLDTYSYAGRLTELKRTYGHVELYEYPSDITECRLKSRVGEWVRTLQYTKLMQEDYSPAEKLRF